MGVQLDLEIESLGGVVAKDFPPNSCYNFR